MTGLMFRIQCSQLLWPASDLNLWPVPKPFKPLQAEATRDQYYGDQTIVKM